MNISLDGDQRTNLDWYIQLSKRSISPIIEDEFDAFAKWIGRKPVFIDKFFNEKVNFDTIDDYGKGSDNDETILRNRSGYTYTTHIYIVNACRKGCYPRVDISEQYYCSNLLSS